MNNRLSTILALLIILNWAAQSSATNQSSITVTDYTGNTVRFAEPAKRIIALAPHIVENLYSVGAGHLVVGTVNSADYPQAAKKIPRVGSSQSLSVEAIVALKPDLIIAWPYSISPEISRYFTDLGLPIYVDDPQILSDIARSIGDIGMLTGKTETAEMVTQNFLRQLSILEAQHTNQTAISVLYQIWNRPLQTINGKHIISDVIRLCGGQNIFADAPVIAPTISMESVLARDPDVIVTSGTGEQYLGWLGEWKTWRQLSAVRHNYLFSIHPDLLQRHTVRLLAGVEQLCEQINQVRSRLGKTS